MRELLLRIIAAYLLSGFESMTNFCAALGDERDALPPLDSAAPSDERAAADDDVVLVDDERDPEA